MARTQGIDTNHWDGKVNGKKMKAAGVEFNIAKFSDFEGTTNVGFRDSEFDNTYRESKDNGVLIGGYHWLQAYADHEIQARYYLDNSKPYKLDFPPVVDFEEPRGLGSSNYLWKLQEYLKIMKDETKRLPIIYTAAWVLNYFDVKKLSFMSEYPLHLAAYTWLQAPPRVPKPWANWTIWQYTDKGDGYKYGANRGDIDLDYYNGDLASLRSFLGLPVSPGTENPDTKGLFQARVTAYKLNVRSSPTVGDNIMRTLKLNDRVTVRAVTGTDTWYLLDDGRYIAGHYDGYDLVEEIPYGKE